MWAHNVSPIKPIIRSTYLSAWGFFDDIIDTKKTLDVVSPNLKFAANGLGVLLGFKKR